MCTARKKVSGILDGVLSLRCTPMSTSRERAGHVGNEMDDVLWKVTVEYDGQSPP
jgi:hypothetical protein